jgi:hypothetical protein
MRRLINKKDMRVTQSLSSGLIIRQDFRTSARFVFFDTGYSDWQYATHGGTLFVVLYKGRPYALTCLHILKDFKWEQLAITDKRTGSNVAGLKSISYPSRPKDAAVDTDILDIAVVEFSDDVDGMFFGDAPYLLDSKTIAGSDVGDILHAYGALKANSRIDECSISSAFALLEINDNTDTSHDPTLRRAIGKFDEPEFSEVQGMSGSPVFNVTKNGLCGVVVRGSLNAGECTIRYVDIQDVCQLLASVHEGLTEVYYHKTISRLKKGFTPSS